MPSRGQKIAWTYSEYHTILDYLVLFTEDILNESLGESMIVQEVGTQSATNIRGIDNGEEDDSNLSGGFFFQVGFMKAKIPR